MPVTDTQRPIAPYCLLPTPYCLLPVAYHPRMAEAIRVNFGKPMPLFALPDAVLLPHAVLPLHIFEPRYRRMLADCLAADRRFGLTPVPEEGGVPEPGAVGCVAEIRVNQELPDGRSNIVVVGVQRFVVSSLLNESLPYLVAMVQTFDDEKGSEPGAEEVEALRQLSLRYLTGLRELSDSLPEDVTLPDDVETLSFHIAGSVESDLESKQRLLAERSTSRRVEHLIRLLPALIGAIENGITVRRRAHSNGKGGRMPDVLTGS
jgi:ATP-dependent Lon protease